MQSVYFTALADWATLVGGVLHLCWNVTVYSTASIRLGNLIKRYKFFFYLGSPWEQCRLLATPEIRVCKKRCYLIIVIIIKSDGTVSWLSPVIRTCHQSQLTVPLESIRWLHKLMKVFACLFICRSSWETVAFEFVLTSPIVTSMSCLSYSMVYEIGGKCSYNCFFVGCCFQDLFKTAREKILIDNLISMIYIVNI